MNKEIIDFIRKTFNTADFIALHYPAFIGNEKKYLEECIDTQFVSYLGKHVGLFEEYCTKFTGSKHAVAIANGTLALHLSLIVTGVNPGDEVLTQAVSFVATANAISYCSASPVFLDSDKKTLGLSPEKLEYFLEKNTVQKENGFTFNKKTGKKISACIPVHVYGHPVQIDKICRICKKFNIKVIEDCAESLGSFYKGKHTGTSGEMGVFSFNGNKVVTTGGGGMIITDNDDIAEKLKYLSTTAKVPHAWEFVHSEIGYNYRMPAVNAAIGCGQMEKLELFLNNKRDLAALYKNYFNGKNVGFIEEPENCKSNYWLNTIIFNTLNEKNAFLEESNSSGVMTRPMWMLLNKLDMYKDCQTDDLEISNWLQERAVNIPSSIRVKTDYPFARY